MRYTDLPPQTPADVKRDEELIQQVREVLARNNIDREIRPSIGGSYLALLSPGECRRVRGELEGKRVQFQQVESSEFVSLRIPRHYYKMGFHWGDVVPHWVKLNLLMGVGIVLWGLYQYTQLERD